MSSIVLSSPASILMVVALSSPPGMLLTSAWVRSLAATLSCCFFGDEFLLLGTLSRSLSSSLC